MRRTTTAAQRPGANTMQIFARDRAGVGAGAKWHFTVAKSKPNKRR